LLGLSFGRKGEEGDVEPLFILICSKGERSPRFGAFDERHLPLKGRRWVTFALLHESQDGSDSIHTGIDPVRTPHLLL
jgi:hypothetical protein